MRTFCCYLLDSAGLINPMGKSKWPCTRRQQSIQANNQPNKQYYDAPIRGTSENQAAYPEIIRGMWFVLLSYVTWSREHHVTIRKLLRDRSQRPHTFSAVGHEAARSSNNDVPDLPIYVITTLSGSSGECVDEKRDEPAARVAYLLVHVDDDGDGSFRLFRIFAIGCLLVALSA